MVLNRTLAVLILCAGFAAPVVAGDTSSEYPHRATYPDLAFITTEQFDEMFDGAIVIDARNNVEFDVLHAVGAHNLPAEKMKKAQLKKLRDIDGETPIVFYCNGNTCSKSYKGGNKAHLWGFKNTYVYDSGIFSWANHKPEASEFFGEPQTAETLKKNLISKADFKAVCVPTSEFIEKANSGDYKIYDIRDRSERTEFKVKIKGIAKMDMDGFVKFLKKDGAVPESNILIIDGKGKQVDWLQYYLVRFNRNNYFFLDGGVRKWKEDGYNESLALVE